MSLPNNDLPRERRKWRSKPWLPAIVLIFLQLASGMRNIPLSAFFLIYLQEQLKLKPVIISSVVSGAQIAGMATALLGGVITTRLGSKWVLICGLILSSLNSLVFQIPSLWLVTLLWFVSGAGMAMVSVSSASYLTQISTQKAIGMLAAFFALSTTIGGAIGNPLVAFFIDQYGFATFSWVVIAFSVGMILVIGLFMTPTQNQPAEPLPVRFFWSEILSTARQVNVRFLVGLRCLPTLFYGMLSVLIPLLINDLSGSKAMVAAYGTINLIVASVAQLLVGQAADRWGARGPTLVSYSAIILSGLGLAVFTGALWGLFVFGVVGIAAAWALSTLMYLWVNDGVSKPEHPSTFGLLYAIWSLSMISGSLFGGWFVASAPALPFLIIGLLNIGSFFLTLAYYDRTSVKCAVSESQRI